MRFVGTMLAGEADNLICLFAEKCDDDDGKEDEEDVDETDGKAITWNVPRKVER